MDTISESLAKKCVQTIKVLSIDGVERAQSGHPGMPMGAADYTFILWNQFLRFSAKNPKWANRDRFVLSAGHGSMLIYSLLYLAGFALSLEDLKKFRQWGSLTPGHPESFRTPGVETTTGPLGQGVTNAVGMALASKILGTRFNRPDFSPIDHFVYAVISDGDVMEGIVAEAASFAGHLRLGNLIAIYDDNHISIDGKTDVTFSEDVEKRFEAYGWHTQRIDGHDHAQIRQALEKARKETERPSLILARTRIAHGAPTKEDTAASHGAPLGRDEVQAFKKSIGWPADPDFFVPEEVKTCFQNRTSMLEAEYEKWCAGFETWRENHQELAELWDLMWDDQVPENLWDELWNAPVSMPNATRSISSSLQQIVARSVPSLMGGSADLASSCNTVIKDSPWIAPEKFEGRNIAFGIREHAMGGIANGMALYGAVRPYTSTFLVFSDYMRASIRLAALSNLRTLFIFTHDSVFLGEDGPTHQPIEHLSSLRLIPNLHVIRPADTKECAAAWWMALQRNDGPTLFSLTRQKLPEVSRNRDVAPEEMFTGAYIAYETIKKEPKVILLATGSELSLAVEAAKILEREMWSVRVVSMLCMERFRELSEKDKEALLGLGNKRRVAIEAGRSPLWHEWVGTDGLIIGIDQFGESAPGDVIAEKLGFTSPAIADRIRKWLKNAREH